MMNEEQKIKLQDALQDDDTFLSFVKQDVRSDEYQTMQRRIAAGPHPTDEMLYDYVLGWLDPEKAAVIKEHLTYCNRCDKEAECIRAIEQHADEKLHSFANTPAEESELQIFELPDTPIPIKDEAYALLANEYKEPFYAGQELSASDLPKQRFSFEEGKIETEIYWEGKRGETPAYIWLSWKVSMPRPCRLHIQFISPETHSVLYKQTIAGIVPNEQYDATFKADKLGFDPSTTRFAFHVFTEEL